MTNRSSSKRRRRSSLLEAVELVRRLDLPSGLNSLVLFLYVCENEGLTMSELASVSGMGFATSARLTRTVAGCAADNPAPSFDALLELRDSTTDRRVSHVFLTTRGRQVRDELESIIARASPIQVELHEEAASRRPRRADSQAA